jgi:exopolysaccharide biosynthesis protein
LNTAYQWISNTTNYVRGWSRFKRFLLAIALLASLSSTFLFFTPPGTQIREFLAETVITTQHRDWAWIFVGTEKRDEMIRNMWNISDENALVKQDISAVKFDKNRKIDELVQVKDISGDFWKGKMMYVYDPRSIRVVVPSKPGEGERITSMAERTGAVAGVNGGGFVDPDGLGNGFAPIGPIISGGNLLYIDQDGNVPQHIVGFTKEGTLVIGKYTYPELQKLGVTEAVMFYPRVIANGKPLITSGDGGWGRGPRTAVGQRADGTVIFVVIDGRQAHSVGATLREVQDLLLSEGAVNAGFLDGGASSELVYDGEVITKPSSRYGERRLPSAFLVFDHPEKLKNARIWDGLTQIDPGGAYDNPYYQADLKAHPEKYQQQTTTKKDTEKPASDTGQDKPAGSGSSTGKTGTEIQSGTKTGEKTGSQPTGTGKEGTTGTAPKDGTGTSAGTGTQTGGTGTGTSPGAEGTSPSTGKSGTGAGTSNSTSTGTSGSGSATGSNTTGTGAAAPDTGTAPSGGSAGSGSGTSGSGGSPSSGSAGTATKPATGGSTSGTESSTKTPTTQSTTTTQTTTTGTSGGTSAQ